MSGGAIFVGGVDMVPYLIAGMFFFAAGGAWALFYALIKRLGFMA